jgi:hypothetical protein
MSTSMQDNTEDLRDILETVNSLPDTPAEPTYEIWEGGSY